VESLKPYLTANHKSALILGTGGASKAIAFALNTLNISFSFVSRTPDSKNCLGYDALNSEIIAAHQIIINCTPLGTHPKIELYPPISYQGISKDHLLFDLIYNPSQTQFLKFGLKAKATAVNGLRMLELQAEKSWGIWNS
jgi:shikimate dehydrogenase